MKIELEQHDLDYINKINAAIDSGEEFARFIRGNNTNFYLDIKCVDEAKANAFVANLLTPNSEIQMMIRDTLGISVNSVSYLDLKSKCIDRVRQVLEESLRELESLQ